MRKKFKHQFKKSLTAENDAAISQASTKYDLAFQELVDKCLFIIKIKGKFMSDFFIKVVMIIRLLIVFFSKYGIIILTKR
ncbi:hypothetical protein QRY03_13115 [Enterococcus hirae]|uniref:hypothetical protein n=1 Tax=Enterococcus hirae TaxID=1354 RepID=UPI00255B23DB|nr:hypothetical protein [Enterococcus hirae]MDL4900810.1 hypothetical protein [Enterococcus hirae]MDL4906031.1 hypothetical protein [Enterococcus hirae]MDL4918822.1 hypothetical protein [Enterococcus hirae]MDL4927968.1 hypothetical protein [Enterococcus hirae]MDL4956150.1 hypothetical protein [Enterococcus hirae]